MEPGTPGRKKPQQQVSTFLEMEFTRKVAILTENLPCGREEGNEKESVLCRMVPSKDVPILIPRTYTWVTLHDKGELRLLIGVLEMGR